MLQFLAIGQNPLAGQSGRHLKPRQGQQMGAHVLEGLNRCRIDRIGGGLGSTCRWGLGVEPGAVSDRANRAAASFL